MNTKYSILLIFLCILFWGLWGFLNKIAVSKIGLQLSLWNTLSFSVVIVLFLFATQQLYPIKQDTTGIVISILSGILSATASLIFYYLLGKNTAGFLVAVTALYPLITILLSMIFLQEQVNVTKAIGFTLALAALFFLNI